MNFLKKHYEKIILAVFLLVFIISLVFLIFALSRSMEINEDDLKFPMKPPEYKKMDQAEFDFGKKIEAEGRWNKALARDEDSKEFTDLMVSFQFARCPNPECRKFISISKFTDGGKCPLCNYELRTSGQTQDPTKVDTDEDEIPDAVESEVGLNPNDPDDAEGDIDGDGFSNLIEYLNYIKSPKSGNGINDLKIHPPYAERLYIKEVKYNYLPIMLTKVTPHGDDMKTWDIQVEETSGPREKTKFYKLGATLTLNGREFKIKELVPVIIEESVDKANKNKIKKTYYNVLIQEGEDKPITVVEKKQVRETKGTVVIVDSGNDKEYMVTLNEEFAVGEKLGETEKYKLASLNEKEKTAILKRSDGKEFKISARQQEEIKDEIDSPVPVDVPAPVKKNPTKPKRPETALPPGGMPPGMMPPGMTIDPKTGLPVMPKTKQK